MYKLKAIKAAKKSLATTLNTHNKVAHIRKGLSGATIERKKKALVAMLNQHPAQGKLF